MRAQKEVRILSGTIIHTYVLSVSPFTYYSCIIGICMCACKEAAKGSR